MSKYVNVQIHVYLTDKFSFYWLTSAVHWLLCSNDSIQRPDVFHYTKTKTRKKTITGLRAAKHGNTCAQDGRVTDWTAVAAYRRRKW